VQFYWQASSHLPPPTHGSIESQKKKKKLSHLKKKLEEDELDQPKVKYMAAKNIVVDRQKVKKKLSASLFDAEFCVRLQFYLDTSLNFIKLSITKINNIFISFSGRVSPVH